MTGKPAILYSIAALAGLGMALFMALDIPALRPLATQSHTIARVNNAAIPAAEYVRALDAMQAGLQRPLTEQDRARALGVLIDEELIVQEALRLNLASDDRLVRKNLIQSLINSVILLDAPQDASDQQLLEFYQKEISLFAAPVRVTVHAFRITDNNRIRVFLHALENDTTFSQAGKLAGFEAINLPAGITAGKLGELLGGPARDTVINMVPGDIAGPVDSSGEIIYLWLLAREGGERSFDQVKTEVSTEWQRRQEEKALETYLIRLRKQARIKQYTDRPLPQK